MSLRVNLGAGLQAYEHQGYISIDKIKSDGIDIMWNLDYGLPRDEQSNKVFADNTVDEFLCKHFLEHLTHEGFLDLMNDMWDALKPDGVLRMYVPNAEHIIAAHSDPTHRLVFTRETMGYFTRSTLAAFPYTDRPWKILEFSVNGSEGDWWELYWKMQPDKEAAIG